MLFKIKWFAILLTFYLTDWHGVWSWQVVARHYARCEWPVWSRVARCWRSSIHAVHKARHNGPYSWKRDKYSPGISLTKADLIYFSFVLQVNSSSSKWQIKLGEVLKAEVTSSSPCFCVLFHLENNMQNSPFSQTYSWNKVDTSFMNSHCQVISWWHEVIHGVSDWYDAERLDAEDPLFMLQTGETKCQVISCQQPSELA